MRQIDADAYASEMKKRQDACMDAMADAHSDRMYTENEHWAGVLAAFAEAKITLDKMPTVGGWVSVKDRLPEPEEKVLIWTKTGCMRYAQYHEDGSKNPWYVYEDDARAWTNVISHWMPLPEPPKEDDHE